MEECGKLFSERKRGTKNHNIPMNVFAKNEPISKKKPSKQNDIKETLEILRKEQVENHNMLVNVIRENNSKHDKTNLLLEQLVENLKNNK